MRNVAGILLVLALLGVFMLPGLSGASADVRAALQLTATVTHTTTQRYLGPFPNMTGTPRAVMPVVLNLPTLTPTQTATPTITPTPTRTSTPTQTIVASPTRTGVPGATGFTGRIFFVEPKTRYYTNIEWIKFWEQIYNPTGHPMSFTILGVNVWKDEQFPFPDTNLGFHTSWTGAPDWILSGCWGPNGYTDWNIGHNYRCAPNENEGFHQDHVGEASNIEITTPGNYWIELWVCTATHDQCLHGGGGPDAWKKLGQNLNFIADPNPLAHGVIQPTQMPQTKCYLNTEDPDNIYLKCDE